jgi:4-hydroxy-3-methylbut-2-enyl diphosphate reductase
LDGYDELRLDWLNGAATIGITAGASAPETKVQELIAALRGLGPVTVEEHRVREERVVFSLPSELRS